MLPLLSITKNSVKKMYKKEDYITAYSQFEQWCKDHNYKDVNDLENRLAPYTTLRNDLYFFRKIRNFYAHHPKADKRLKLTDIYKSDFQTLCKMFMAELSEVAIPESDIFKQKLSDPIGPAVKVMKERVYTHIPIMTGQRVWGVFSESTLFDLAGKGLLSKIDESTRFVDLGSSITYRKTGVYDFVDSNVSLEDIRRIFNDAMNERRKLDVLFITSTGTKDGNLLGMITVWDIAAL